MALIARATRTRQYDPDVPGPVTIDGVAVAEMDYQPFLQLLHGSHILGEAVEAGTPLYRKDSDDKWYKSAATDGTAESDQIHGWSETKGQAGGLVNIFYRPVNFGYSDGTAPKAEPLFLSTTAGRLSDTVAYPGQEPCAFSNDGYNVIVNGQTFPKVGRGVGVLPAPGSVAAADGVGSSAITWNAVAGAVGYVVEKSTAASGAAFVHVTTVFSDDVTVTEQATGTWYYRVTAFNNWGMGLPSAADAATIT